MSVQSDLQQSLINGVLAANGFGEVTAHVDDELFCIVEGYIPEAEAEEAIAELLADFEIAGLETRLEVEEGDDDVLELGEDETYTVAKGDSWWRIAKRVYGDGRKWKELKEANGNPKVIHPGDELVIPPVDELA